MKKSIVLFAVLLIAYLSTRKIMSNDVKAALSNKNVQAFLGMIRGFESGSDYSILYGGSHFDDFSRHPDIKIPFYNPQRSGEQGIPNDFSTAAGAYQINWPTWITDIQPLAFLPDFTPNSQDEAAVWLLKVDGALSDIIAGNFDAALRTASKRWASLPYSTAGQRKQSYSVALAEYKGNGGLIA